MMQEDNGSWTKFTFKASPRVYHGRVAYALLMLWEITGENKIIDAANNNYDWVLMNQDDDGWFQKCSFFDGSPTFLHTIAYVIESLIYGYIVTNKKEYFDAAKKSADFLMSDFINKGRLAGNYEKGWKGVYNYRCLSGDAQVSSVWFKLFQITGDKIYKDSAFKLLNSLLPFHIVKKGKYGIRGGLAGSYPFWGKYMPFEFPNWGVKFLADALMEGEKYGEVTEI